MDLYTFFNTLTATIYGFVALITWVVLQAVKQTRIDNRWLPLLAILIGGVIGAVAAFGTLSGFASTGLNETLNRYAFDPTKGGK